MFEKAKCTPIVIVITWVLIKILTCNCYDASFTFYSQLFKRRSRTLCEIAIDDHYVFRFLLAYRTYVEYLQQECTIVFLLHSQ